MNWNNFLEDYLTYLKIERSLSLNSLQGYERDIKKLIIYLDDNKMNVSPIHINDEQVQQFLLIKQLIKQNYFLKKNQIIKKNF